MATPNMKQVWAGRIITGLIGAMLLASGVMKLKGGPELEEGIKPLGLPLSMITPLGILEIACVVIYLIPQTTVIGAILLTGYLGGAICTHWRVGDQFAVQAILGVFVWLGVCLRDDRLWALMPIRSSPPAVPPTP
jgi:uncharacterized membrane protein YphA (DoxX/SURF4 family)